MASAGFYMMMYWMQLLMYVEYDTWYRNSVYFYAIVTNIYHGMKLHQKWEGVPDVLHEIINKTERDLVKKPTPLINTPNPAGKV